MSLETFIRNVPDFPKPGINFLDFSPLLEDPKLFKETVESLAKSCSHLQFDKLIAIESRGFILGAALAQHMERGFVMVRKKGKLPGKTHSHSYDLEYGSDTLEILEHSLEKGEKVLIIDDVLATGGTAQATETLVNKVGAQVTGFLFLIELSFLKGREKLQAPICSVITK